MAKGRLASSRILSGAATALIAVCVLQLAGAPAGRAAAAGSGASLPSARGSEFMYWANTDVQTIARATLGPLGVMDEDQAFMSLDAEPLGIALDHRYLYFGAARGLAASIGRANLDGTGVNSSFIPLASAAGPVDLAVDGQHIYWIEKSDDSVGRANLDGSDPDPRFITGLGYLTGLAVDGHHIYWTDLALRTIGRADLDGLDIDRNFINLQSEPGPIAGLAVDPGHIYWADQGAGTIGRATLDGGEVTNSFIAGAGKPLDLTDDYRHIYWTDQGSGTIGRADLDGSEVDDRFIIAAAGALGDLCFSNPELDCAPWGLAVTPPTDPYCLHAATAPAPPTGGAVFARPIDPNSSDANVVVLPAGGTWNGEASCLGEGRGSAEVMSHPASIEVSPGWALELHDTTSNLTSAWGAQNVAAGAAAPVLYPGRPDWTTTDAEVVAPETLLDSYDTCRECVLPAGLHVTPRPLDAQVSYTRDLSGATMTNATLSGDFRDWSFVGADLTGATVGADADVAGARFAKANLAGATLDGAIADGAVFDRSDLRGAQLSGLQYQLPPSFAGVQVGQFKSSCTQFRDMDLVNTRLTPTVTGSQCAKTPLLPGSDAPLGLLYVLAHTYHGDVGLTDARFVASARDRGRLAGADLSGIDLSGSSFLGFPADLVKTHFDDATLAGTSFKLADLAGATFKDVQAPGASFQDAELAAAGGAGAASFAGTKTDLSGADFVGADVSGVSFQSADLSRAVFNRARAADTDFNSVIATNAVFSAAHIYGDGQAFDGARDLSGADFSGAVLAGDTSQGAGFDLTDADLTGAKFDRAQCVGCRFTGSNLSGVSFSSAYLPGAVFSGARSLQGVDLADAWLYCGDLENSSCPVDPAFSKERDWSLDLGSQEVYGPLPFASTNLTGVSLNDVTACPDGKAGHAEPVGCPTSDLLPDAAGAPPIPAACSATALDACPTNASTLFDAGAVGAPLSLAAATPPTWATSGSAGGYYAGFDDGTIRLVGSGAPQVVAGHARRHCPGPTAQCGDGGAAAQALLGTPAGLAVALDGSLYVADSALHRVRRIDPPVALSSACAALRKRGRAKAAARTAKATRRARIACAARTKQSKRSTIAAEAAIRAINTVAGSGGDCSTAGAQQCGDGGLATKAALRGPYGVWIDPTGRLYIADGLRGIREVLPDGTITSIGPRPGHYDIRSVVGGPGGNLYAATHDPDYLLKINLSSGVVTIVVGTGTSGYNGNSDEVGSLLPGTKVQINDPQGLSMASDGRVLFADTDNDLIRAFVPSTGHVSDELAGVVQDGVPQGGPGGDGNPGNQTELDHPRAVSATRGALFVVADTNNRRIRLIGPNPPDDQ